MQALVAALVAALLVISPAHAAERVIVAFGQNICQPVSPRCSLCPVRGACPRLGVTRSR